MEIKHTGQKKGIMKERRLHVILSLSFHAFHQFVLAELLVPPNQPSQTTKALMFVWVLTFSLKSLIGWLEVPRRRVSCT